ncbi:MAG: hypothetical protein HQL46_05645 [Gammaproteobacteria bacterium]|nr:hypothetical protein [Gammaproteobacteria bacterium]
MRPSVKNLLLTLLVAAVFSGCMSGGSSSSSTYTITGTASDGYLQQAIVCLDFNANSLCDEGEPNSLTDEEGNYSLVLTKEQQKSLANIIAYDGIDSDTGMPFDGILQAPNDGSSIHITPITTIVTKMVDLDISDLSNEEHG